MFAFSGKPEKKMRFYLVLVCAFCIVLGTGLWSTQQSSREAQGVEEEEVITFPKLTDGAALATPQPTAEPQEPAPVIEEASGALTVEETEEQPAAQTTFAPAYPVYGKILVPFSGDGLVYSVTLNDYRSHRGMDIAAPLLEKVRAVEAGTVTVVKTDPLMGITVEIEHAGGFVSRYANLSTDEMVKVGQKVEKGTVISGVGDTAMMETGEEAHLHFELWQDGAPVNPMDYLIK